MPLDIESILEKLDDDFVVTSENLVASVRMVMEIVETFEQASGADKKRAVLECIEVLLRTTDAGALEAAEPAVLALLPHIIDELVVCSRNGLSINKQYRRRASCRCLVRFLRRVLCRCVCGSR